MGSDSPSESDGVTQGRRLVRPPKPGKALSVFFVVVGLAILLLGSYSYVVDSARLGNSVEVRAEITDTDIEEVEVTRGRVRYAPVVTYEYSYRGTDYTSDNIFPEGRQTLYTDRADAEARLSAYAVGETVTAHVDPDARGQAFLENSRSGQAMLAVGIGLVIVLVAGGRLYQVWGRSSDTLHST